MPGTPLTRANLIRFLQGKGALPTRPPMPPLGSFVLYRADWDPLGGSYVEARYGDDQPPRLAGGYGGWEEIQRPKRASLLDWAGSSLFALAIPFQFGDYRAGLTVEPVRRRLEQMATRQGRPEPPRVKLLGRGLPDTARKIPLWVIEQLEWDGQWHSQAGALVMATGTVTLRQWADPDQIDVLRPRRVDCSKARSKVKLVTVRKGETVQRIAARHLGSAQCWRRIQRRDPRTKKYERITDPRQVKAGDRLRLP